MLSISNTFPIYIYLQIGVKTEPDYPTDIRSESVNNPNPNQTDPDIYWISSTVPEYGYGFVQRSQNGADIRIYPKPKFNTLGTEVEWLYTDIYLFQYQLWDYIELIFFEVLCFIVVSHDVSACEPRPQL